MIRAAVGCVWVGGGRSKRGLEWGTGSKKKKKKQNWGENENRRLCQ